jgi:hypothetical protein
LPPLDAATGTPDATPLPRPDAAPGDLAIYALSPSIVDEGMGVGRAVPVAILGANIEQGAMVRLTGPGKDGEMQALEVSENGDLAVFELVLPVDTALGEAATTPITVEVLQGGQMESLSLTVNWLDELVVTAAASLDTATLAAKYSSIDIGADVQAQGDAPLRLVATAELVLAASVDAAGSNGGPGRCRRSRPGRVSWRKGRRERRGGGGNGGGGGSGGAILLRSAAPIDDSADADFLVLGGGQGGTNNCSGEGGDGAAGRARVDAPELPASAASAFPFHGAVLDPATPIIVRAPMLTVTVRGGGGKTFAVTSPLTAPQPVPLDVDGHGTGDVMLMPGVNRVCVLMTQTDLPSGDDENCIDVAYVP